MTFWLEDRDKKKQKKIVMQNLTYDAIGGNKRCLIDSVWVNSLSRAINKQSKKAVV